jgi:ATP-dependent Clp protease ATP-binding subunit ClpX
VASQAGYVGEDVESVLSKLLVAANYDVQKARTGIVFIDEIDKIAKRGGSHVASARDVSGEGVQQALLKVIEGSVISVPITKSSSPKCDHSVMLDTTNILFICGGAFSGIDALVSSRLHHPSIGFERPLKTAAQLKSSFDSDSLQQVDAGDLVNYGLIPEFVGRFPSIAPLTSLSVAVRSPGLFVCMEYVRALV